ncbi:MAG: hypothetical protein EOM37_05885 [Proteobacteria bacterium]|jgi:hypothetical protein|nr:DUF6468 domain-containing protein [Alphaproteobacteria bacterium]NCC03559.1 hypothetical protein [Pseudomonadota bacterium]
MSFIAIFLDVVMIGLLGTGIFYAVRLTRQLAEMRASRAEMQRFVIDFNQTVLRAEAGVQNLKHTARSSGDDLEKLIEKSHSLRDELMFLVESADQAANRLSQRATSAKSVAAPTPQTTTPSSPKNIKEPASAPKATVPKAEPFSFKAASTAEQELLRVLKKLG